MWFKILLAHFNCVTFFQNPTIHHQVSLGVSRKDTGGVSIHDIYDAQIPESFKSFNIAILEVINIRVTLRFWATIWRNKVIVTIKLLSLAN